MPAIRMAPTSLLALVPVPVFVFGLVLGLGLGLGLASPALGCGGDAKKPAPVPAARPDPAEPEQDDDELIAPEKFDEIQAFFDRKRSLVTRCFTDAIDAGELPERSKGWVTLSMVITEKGQATNVSVAEATLTSDTLYRCLEDYVTRWSITTLPKPLEYSYTFAFDTL